VFVWVLVVLLSAWILLLLVLVLAMLLVMMIAGIVVVNAIANIYANATADRLSRNTYAAAAITITSHSHEFLYLQPPY
jgi:hypothetical protein